MNKDDYINDVLKHISNKAFIGSIRQELEGHIDDRILYYEEIGYDTDSSTEKAIAHLGNADKLGEEMNLLHNYKKHRIISITGLILFALNMLMLYCTHEVLKNFSLEISYIAILIYTCISLVISSFVYKFAFEAREKTILTIQGILTALCGISFLTTFDLAIAVLPGRIYCMVAVLVLLIHSIMCFTCSAEINALIKGRGNHLILKRYKKYEYFLIAVTVIAIVSTIVITVTFIKSEFS